MTWGGGRPHTNVGDRGQRYEVRWQDLDGAEKVLGWAADSDGAQQMAEAWAKAPYVARAWVLDREPT